MRVSLIVAVSENGVIGKGNNLPWHLPKDMQFFKNKTTGHHVIMGRKNHESIPHKFRPLPNRTNIVITRNKKYVGEGCIIVNSLEEALKISKDNQEKETFIIGGGEIYKIALEKKLVDRIYLTRIYHCFNGDTFFPKIDSNWKEIEKKENKADAIHSYDFDFIIYEKKVTLQKNK